MASQIKFAQEHEFVETIINRRRYIPQINASNKIQSEFAKRIAINSPIQGSAADIMKYAMIKLDNYINQEGINAKMILQIHDEIVFQVEHGDEQQDLAQKFADIMEEAFPLEVKLKTEAIIANNLYNLK
jgi:DNA polymerase-1